jgi:peptide deformylase
MIYPVVVYGHPVLRKVAEDIKADYKDLSEIIENMWETMYAADGIGLAAPQIGKSIRLFVIDATPLEEDHPELADFKKVFINAQIVDRFDEEDFHDEGCLSLPTIREEVKRPTSITIEYLDENFQEKKETYTGFAARVIQHEYDHIEGKLFVDYLSPLKKRLLKGRLAKVSKGEVDVSYSIKVPVASAKGRRR